MIDKNAEGQTAYVIAYSLDAGRYKMIEGKVNWADCECASLDVNGREWVFGVCSCYETPEEALKYAYAENQVNQKKLAEKYLDLVRIEAELELKREDYEEMKAVMEGKHESA